MVAVENENENDHPLTRFFAIGRKLTNHLASQGLTTMNAFPLSRERNNLLGVLHLVSSLESLVALQRWGYGFPS
jgi:hypothetical protein